MSDKQIDDVVSSCGESKVGILPLTVNSDVLYDGESGLLITRSVFPWLVSVVTDERVCG